jgi:predicted  nucleic acid-binding Zn-ribbon protein
MHPGIKRLLELQSVDVRLNELRATVESFPKRLKELDTRLESARQQLAAAKEAHTNALKQRKTYEMDVDQWKERARKYRDQSAAVKTNEAYKALQHEIANAEAEVAKAEDRLLERMVSGEEFERQVKAADRTLKEAEAETQTVRKRLESEQAAAQAQLAAVTAERDLVVAPIDEDLLYHYHRIAKRHNGIALAEVRNETCLLCGMRVRPHVYQELRRASSDELFHCETCTRILYVTETQVAAAADTSTIPAASPPEG